MEIYKGRKLLTSIVWEKRKKMRGQGRRNYENFPVIRNRCFKNILVFLFILKEYI